MGPGVRASPVEIIRLTGGCLSFGIEEHLIGQVIVRIYSPAKTVADCFKFRSRVGLDVALEALRETWRSRKATMDELWEAAKVCRVSNAIAPLPGGGHVNRAEALRNTFERRRTAFPEGMLSCSLRSSGRTSRNRRSGRRSSGSPARRRSRKGWAAPSKRWPRS